MLTPMQANRGHHAAVAALKSFISLRLLAVSPRLVIGPRRALFLVTKTQETYDQNDSSQNEAIGSTKTLVDSKREG